MDMLMTACYRFAMILFCLILVTGCNPEDTNTGPDDAPPVPAGSVVCDENAFLAMYLAPVAIPGTIQDLGTAANTESAPYHCDKMHVAATTRILPRQDYPELSSACRSRFAMELYFSGSLQDMESLPQLRTQAEARADALRLPATVGRMVEQDRMFRGQWRGDTLNVRRLEGFSNSQRFEAQIPNFVFDFSHAVDFSAPIHTNPRYLAFVSATGDSQRFAAGTTLHYRWAKRIFTRTGDGLIFGDIHSFTVPARNNPPQVRALSHPNILFPENTTATIRATANDSDGRIVNVTWRWIPNPLPDPVIVSPNSPNTQVIVSDWGDYTFEILATDNCGAQSSDQMTLYVDREQPTTFQTRIQSGDTCDVSLNARFRDLFNPTLDTMRVTILETWDYSNWNNPEDNVSGQVLTNRRTFSLSPGERIQLGCTVSRGSGTRGHEYAIVSYRILEERRE